MDRRGDVAAERGGGTPAHVDSVAGLRVLREPVRAVVDALRDQAAELAG
ncbi:hypothetical protein [Actinomadura verrucosospora]|nr:hypothetical protein [Actinomadura verrucosospora]